MNSTHSDAGSAGAQAHPLGPLAPLGAYRQFIPVLLVPRADKPGKTDKLPLDHRTGAVTAQGSGGAHDPAIWTDYDSARRVAATLGQSGAVGFVITAADPFWCLDIDGCLTGGAWSPLSQALVARLPGTVCEVSQSGAGLHVWGRGPVPAHAVKNTALGLELYSELRFIALGGHAVGTMADACPEIAAVAAEYFPPRALSATPAPDTGPRADWNGPTDDDELIRRAMMSRSAAAVFGGARASFADLWHADADALARAYPPSPGNAKFDPYNRSAVDAALAQHLAFWTGCDAARIERLMRRSALVREKWDREDYLGARTITNACAMQREVLRDRKAPASALATATPPGDSDAPLSFLAAAQGAIPSTIECVADALRSVESGIRIAYDEFRGRIVIARATAGAWRPLRDVDYGILRAEFGRRGFKPVAAEIMKTAVDIVAEANRFDSAVEWADTLTWDGQPRIDTFLSAYCGATDTPYSRSVGAYTWTALAGRLLSPGCQVDMVPVFVSPTQGLRKSTAISAIVPDPELFAEVNFEIIESADISRLLRGKLIAEIAELQGLRGRDREAIKAFITRRVERFIDKWEKFETAYPRRLMFIGTTNEARFLHDPTGERRWLPINVGMVSVEAIEGDRAQLWAEGITRYRAGGVEFREAERLARFEHDGFKDDDEWQPLIERWLAESPAPLMPAMGRPPTPRGTEPFLLADLAHGALGLAPDRLDRKQQTRIGAILRTLGYEKRQTWLAGKNLKTWHRVASLPLAHT